MPPLDRRDAGWLLHPLDDEPGEQGKHPAVLMRIVPERGFLFMLGTGTPRNRSGRKLKLDEIPPAPTRDVFWIDHRSPDWKAMGLSKRTYFSAWSQKTLSRPEIEVVTKVSLGLFTQLQALLGITER